MLLWGPRAPGRAGPGRHGEVSAGSDSSLSSSPARAGDGRLNRQAGPARPRESEGARGTGWAGSGEMGRRSTLDREKKEQAGYRKRKEKLGRGLG